MGNNLINDVIERLNNKIKTGFKKYYGFKSRKYRDTMIYLMTGKLNYSHDVEEKHKMYNVKKSQRPMPCST